MRLNHRFLLVVATFFMAKNIAAIKVNGKVLDKETGEPIPFAVIIIQEEKIKSYSDDKGDYKFDLKNPGEYTLRVSHQEWKPLQKKMKFEADMSLDINLYRYTIKGKILTIKDKRQIQKVSRYTMTVQETKLAIGSADDALQALQNLPGVLGSSTALPGIPVFGALNVRGARSEGNLYLIDGIPVLTPMHMGGLHAIFATDILSEVDLYSSSFPARYGNATSAVFSLNTLDNIEKQSWVLNGGLITANGARFIPLYSNYTPTIEQNQSLQPTKESESVKSELANREYKGYAIASARTGYIPLVYGLYLEIKNGIQKINDSLNDKPLNNTQGGLVETNPFPYYFDYQLKLKYFINKNTSVKFMFLGYGDYLVGYSPEPTATPDSTDTAHEYTPLTETGMHSQAVYLIWQPSEKFYNQILFFSSLNRDFVETQINNFATGTKTSLSRELNPNVFGLKNETRLFWINNDTYFNAGIEYYLYNFSGHGEDIKGGYITSNLFPGSNTFNFDYNNIELVSFEKTVNNHLFTTYIENRFQFGGFIFTPGFRASYLNINQEWTYDPRFLLSYEFPSNTTISLSGGHYSSYLQTNGNYISTEPNIVFTEKYISEKSWQSSLGVEQLLASYSLRAELFYNYYYDLSQPYINPDYVDEYGQLLTRINSGIGRNYGFEILLKKDTRESERGLFGWVSYTYTIADMKTGVPDQSYKDIYINSPLRAPHAIKTLVGWRFKHQSISARLNFWSPYPQTKITGYKTIQDDEFSSHTDVTFSDTPYTEVAPDLNMEFDFRFTWFTMTKTGGRLTLYIELLMLQSAIYYGKTYYSVDSEKPIQEGVNPTWIYPGAGLPFLPNFGIEYKF